MKRVSLRSIVIDSFALIKKHAVLMVSFAMLFLGIELVNFETLKCHLEEISCGKRILLVLLFIVTLTVLYAIFLRIVFILHDGEKLSCKNIFKNKRFFIRPIFYMVAVFCVSDVWTTLFEWLLQNSQSWSSVITPDRVIGIPVCGVMFVFFRKMFEKKGFLARLVSLLFLGLIIPCATFALLVISELIKSNNIEGWRDDWSIALRMVRIACIAFLCARFSFAFFDYLENKAHGLIASFKESYFITRGMNFSMMIVVMVCGGLVVPMMFTMKLEDFFGKGVAVRIGSTVLEVIGSVLFVGIYRALQKNKPAEVMAEEKLARGKRAESMLMVQALRNCYNLFKKHAMFLSLLVFSYALVVLGATWSMLLFLVALIGSVMLLKTFLEIHEGQTPTFKRLFVFEGFFSRVIQYGFEWLLYPLAGFLVPVIVVACLIVDVCNVMNIASFSYTIDASEISSWVVFIGMLLFYWLSIRLSFSFYDYLKNRDHSYWRSLKASYALTRGSVIQLFFFPFVIVALSILSFVPFIFIVGLFDVSKNEVILKMFAMFCSVLLCSAYTFCKIGMYKALQKRAE